MRSSKKIQDPPRNNIPRAPAAFLLMLACGLNASPLIAAPSPVNAATSNSNNPWLRRYAAAMHAYHAGDYTAAYRRFRALADMGSAGAQTMIGHLHLSGKGVDQANGKAFLWFHRAAGRGYAPAQLATARAYAQGKGIKQSNIDAALWLSLVEARGTPELSATARAELRRITASMSVDDLAKLARLKKNWRPDVALMP